MKLATILIALAFAGCMQGPEEALEAATTNAAPPIVMEPFAAEGTVWLPPSSGQDRAETLILFPVNATGSGIVADFALGSMYGPLDLPAVLTDVLVELRAPDGTVLAEGALNMESTEAHLEVERTEAVGEHTLAILSYGGSDEEANGDYVAWKVEVTPS